MCCIRGSPSPLKPHRTLPLLESNPQKSPDEKQFLQGHRDDVKGRTTGRFWDFSQGCISLPHGGWHPPTPNTHSTALRANPSLSLMSHTPARIPGHFPECRIQFLHSGKLLSVLGCLSLYRHWFLHSHSIYVSSCLSCYLSTWHKSNYFVAKGAAAGEVKRERKETKCDSCGGIVDITSSMDAETFLRIKFPFRDGGGGLVASQP